MAKIEVSTNKETLSASGEVMKFDGFLKVYLESNDDEDEEATAGEGRKLTTPISGWSST